MVKIPDREQLELCLRLSHEIRFWHDYLRPQHVCEKLFVRIFDIGKYQTLEQALLIILGTLKRSRIVGKYDERLERRKAKQGEYGTIKDLPNDEILALAVLCWLLVLEKNQEARFRLLLERKS